MEPLVHRKQLRKTNIIINFLPMQTVWCVAIFKNVVKITVPTPYPALLTFLILPSIIILSISCSHHFVDSFRFPGSASTFCHISMLSRFSEFLDSFPIRFSQLVFLSIFYYCHLFLHLINGVLSMFLSSHLSSVFLTFLWSLLGPLFSQILRLSWKTFRIEWKTCTRSPPPPSADMCHYIPFTVQSTSKLSMLQDANI
jgi:hypothetical protein